MFLPFLSWEFRAGKGIDVLSHFDLLHFPGDQPCTNRGGGKSWFTSYRFSPKLDSPLVFPISGNDTTSHSVAQVPNLGVYFVLSSPLSPIFRPLAGFIDFSFQECLKPVHSSLSPPYPPIPMRFLPPVTPSNCFSTPTLAYCQFIPHIAVRVLLWKCKFFFWEM